MDTLKDEQTTLNEEKARLEDPTYVQNYARGTHLLSKSGEQVFILPKGE
ncbi:septum formation initiator family protein [Erysipelothrix sp. D19-032]